MQLSSTLLLCLGLVSSSFAAPQGDDDGPDGPSGHLDFYAAAANYSRDVPLDGGDVSADPDLNVNIIIADFDAYNGCNFDTPQNVTLVPSDDGKTIEVGPPQPILKLNCETS
ncbi:hypothetical protein GGR53DRAFT_491777 [Hypoxylon sp. FL1150]|nr:hypothetical protein GGR53DRAFT_491777 [Hypoxylon sp. FL1150]